MERLYADMYALFRHNPDAEAFYNALPSYVQDKISARYLTVDSLDRLRSYAESIFLTGGLRTDPIDGVFLPSPWTF